MGCVEFKGTIPNFSNNTNWSRLIKMFECEIVNKLRIFTIIVCVGQWPCGDWNQWFAIGQKYSAWFTKWMKSWMLERWTRPWIVLVHMHKTSVRALAVNKNKTICNYELRVCLKNMDTCVRRTRKFIHSDF